MARDARAAVAEARGPFGAEAVADVGAVMDARVVLGAWARQGVERRVNAEKRDIERCIGASVWEDGDETAAA